VSSRIATFTGSASGPVEHGNAVAAFAAELAARRVRIVYGGGRAGLIGVVAGPALAVAGEVIGVMPRHLVDQEIAHDGLSRLEFVADMHHRKARMAERPQRSKMCSVS
jgi:predicted Rossmann-fold nucleotide-binding protein